MATSSEFSMYKNLSIADKSDMTLELAAFIDGGLFWDREKNDIRGLNNYFSKRTLADAGFGLRLNTSIFEKDLYLRLDFPIYIFNGDISETNFNNWVFSFQRSI